MNRLRGTDVATIATLIAAFGLLVACHTRSARLHREAGECVSNLRNLDAAYETFILENGKPVTEFPINRGGTGEHRADHTMVYMHFRALVPFCIRAASASMVADILVCPLDSRQPAFLGEVYNTNISYFLSLNPPATSNPDWILMGNRNISLNAQLNVSRNRENAMWIPEAGLHGNTGYLLFRDGSVRRVGDENLSKLFTKSGNQTNRLAVP
jgi:hypothetical protein